MAAGKAELAADSSELAADSFVEAVDKLAPDRSVSVAGNSAMVPFEPFSVSTESLALALDSVASPATIG